MGYGLCISNRAPKNDFRRHTCLAGAFWALPPSGSLTVEIFLSVFLYWPQASFKHLPIFWSLGFTLVLHFLLKYERVTFFPLISLTLLNHFQEEERPTLIYAVTSEDVLLLFSFFPLIMFHWIHFLIFLCITCLISICWLYIWQVSEPQKHAKLKKPVTKPTYLKWFYWYKISRTGGSI